jgi:hypothetical protein
MFAGTLAPAFACVLVLPGVLRRAGVAADRAYHWSAGAWFALLPVFIYSFTRASLRRGDTSAAPPGPRPSGAA